MSAPDERNASRDTKPQPPADPNDPRTRRGPPQRLEDTNAAGDALNDTGEDNHHQKEQE